MEKTTLTLGLAQTIYGDLDPSKQEMRIALLQPAPGLEDDVYVALEKVTLADKRPYEAVSYCWSGSPEPFNIHLNGKVVQITTSLVQALRRLRLRDRERALWADQICIKQTDSDERAQQVRLMGAIFPQAGKVICWLGEHDGPEGAYTAKGFELLNEIVDHASGDWRSWIAAVDKDHSLDHLWRLFWRPWWSRMWVVQEVFLAKEADIVCGAHTTPWAAFLGYFYLEEDFWSALYDSLGSYQRRTGLPVVSAITSLRTVSSVCDPSRPEAVPTRLPSYDWLLNACRTRDCHDPRDRVFSLLKLCRLENAVEVNYKHSVEEVFVEMTGAIINDYSLNTNLLLAWKPYTTPRSNLTLPSWVIDWEYKASRVVRTIRWWLSLSSSFDAALNGIADGIWSYEIGNNAIKQVPSIYVAKIEAIAPREESQTVFNDPTSPIPVFAKARQKLLQSWKAFLQVPSEVFWRVLLFDLVFRKSDETSEFKITRTKEMFIDWSWLDDMLAQPTQCSETDPNDWFAGYIDGKWCTLALEIFDWNAVCKTSSGQPASIPATAEVGDEIHVLAGSRVPWVLRPVLRQPKTFRVIGPCYIHNLMDGMAVYYRLRDHGDCNTYLDIFEKISLV